MIELECRTCGNKFQREEWLKDNPAYNQCNPCYNKNYIEVRVPKDWGWREIVIDLDRDIQDFVPDYRIGQIKEKFGGLRFYIDSVGSENYGKIRSLIDEAETKSFTTCEWCGNSGNLDERYGWLLTLCDEDKEKRRIAKEGN